MRCYIEREEQRSKAALDRFLAGKLKEMGKAPASRAMSESIRFSDRI